MDNAAVGMTQEKYIQVCEAMGTEVDMDKMPPDYHDFPSYIHTALNVFNALPDNFSGGMHPIYVGKDLASLSQLFELFEVDKPDRLMVFEVIQFLDGRARKQAIREAKKNAPKAK